MNKSEVVCVGIDVSARELVVAVGGQESEQRFANTRLGHQALTGWLRRQGGSVRVCVEASGNYSLDLALTLSQQSGVELEVVNPRLARRFAESLGKRSKTDPVDAHMLAEFAARMPFTAWQAPSATALQLRSLVRTIAALTRIATQEKNRRHAAAASVVLAPMIARELQRHTRYLEQRIAKLRQKAQRLVARESAARAALATSAQRTRHRRGERAADPGRTGRLTGNAGRTPVGGAVRPGSATS